MDTHFLCAALLILSCQCSYPVQKGDMFILTLTGWSTVGFDYHILPQVRESRTGSLYTVDTHAHPLEGTTVASLFQQDIKDEFEQFLEKTSHKQHHSGTKKKKNQAQFYSSKSQTGWGLACTL